MKLLKIIILGLILTSNFTYAATQETDKFGRYCPGNSTPYYRLTLKNAQGVTETAAKKTLINTTLNIFTLGGYTLYSASHFTSETEKFYDKELLRCVAELQNGKCPDYAPAGSQIDQGKCLVVPLNNGTQPPSTAESVQRYVNTYEIPCDSNLFPGACGEGSGSSLAGYVSRLYVFGLMIVGLVAFGMLIFSGVKYIASVGNASLQGDAKDQILQAVIGLVLLLSAYIILYTINPKLVSLQNPQAEIVDIEKLAQQQNTYLNDQNQSIFEKTGGGDNGSGGATLPNCQLVVNANVGVNSNIPNSPSQVAGSVCLKCVAGYTKNDQGVCTCDSPGYKAGPDGKCVLQGAIVPPASFQGLNQ